TVVQQVAERMQDMVETSVVRPPAFDLKRGESRVHGLSMLAIEQLLRELTPQVLGAVVRRFHDFAAAEDAVQEASLAAALQWPREGLPDNPRAWLTQVAFRRMTDQIRSDSARRARESESVREREFTVEPDVDSALQQDDTLVLLFMCCHPSLTSSSAI